MLRAHIHHNIHIQGQARLAIKNGCKPTHNHIWNFKAFQNVYNMGEESFKLVLTGRLHCLPAQSPIPLEPPGNAPGQFLGG